MAERVRNKVVEVRILKGGDEAVVISDMAGDEIVFSAERDGVEYDIKFPNGSPFKDANGKPKTEFKARKQNPDRTGKGHYRAGGPNEYHYAIYPPRETVTQGPVPPGDQPGPSSTPLKDPIVIVDP